MRKSYEDFGLFEKDGSVHEQVPAVRVVIWNCGPQMSLSTVYVDPAGLR